jgi:hypothetical protein
MPSRESIDALNRVLAILLRSFPQYLRFARPYIPAGRESVWETVEEISAAQDALAERIGRVIVESGGLPDPGQFPIAFTDTHDLSIDYLVEEAIGYQRQDIADLQHCAESLALSPAAQSLAAESVGMAKGHLESLEDLHVNPGAATIVRNGPPAYAND